MITDYRQINTSAKGGYLVPGVIRKRRPGYLAKIARFFKHSYGWTEYRLADEIRKSVAKDMQKQVEKDAAKCFTGIDKEEFINYLRNDPKKVHGVVNTNVKA